VNGDVVDRCSKNGFTQSRRSHALSLRGTLDSIKCFL
jgi:hypothetical protein